MAGALAFPNVVWPDEIFQTLEQAHRLAFGYGIVPWEFRAGARSWLLPGLLAGAMEAGIHHFKLWTEGFSPPPGEVYVSVESPRGEFGTYINSDGSPKPRRVHFRAPSFANLAALPMMAKGALIADVVAIIGSIDIVMGDVDR